MWFVQCTLYIGHFTTYLESCEKLSVFTGTCCTCDPIISLIMIGSHAIWSNTICITPSQGIFTKSWKTLAWFFSARRLYLGRAHPSKKTQQVLAKLLLVPDMVSGRGHFAPAQHDTKYKTSTKPGFPLGTIKKLYIPVLVTPRPTSGGLCHKDSKIWTSPIKVRFRVRFTFVVFANHTLQLQVYCSFCS